MLEQRHRFASLDMRHRRCIFDFLHETVYSRPYLRWNHLPRLHRKNTLHTQILFPLDWCLGNPKHMFACCDLLCRPKDTTELFRQSSHAQPAPAFWLVLDKKPLAEKHRLPELHVCLRVPFLAIEELQQAIQLCLSWKTVGIEWCPSRFRSYSRQLLEPTGFFLKRINDETC